MAIKDISSLTTYLNKPKLIKVDADCELYVKQLKVSEFEELQVKCKAMEESKDENDVGPSVDIIVSLLTDEKGKALFTTDEEITTLRSNLTLDFIRKFFEKFWESFAFTSKELASSEAQFHK